MDFSKVRTIRVSRQKGEAFTLSGSAINQWVDLSLGWEKISEDSLYIYYERVPVQQMRMAS